MNHENVKPNVGIKFNIPPTTSQKKGVKFDVNPPPPNAEKERKVEKKSWKLDDFLLGKSLGNGKFGMVHIAKEKKHNKVLALKIMWKSDIKEHELEKQIHAEVRIHTELRHKNIVRLYSAFTDEDRIYLALEYVPGGDVLSLMNTYDTLKLPEDKSSQIFRGLVLAVGFCHKHKILHRDIKPENILLAKDGTPKLADFGWACSGTSEQQIQRMKRTTFCGTLDYLPPEIAKREEYDYRADIWMAGCVLYEMLVGATPFYNDDIDQTTYNITDQTEKQLPSWVSTEAKELLKIMLQKNVSKRMNNIRHCLPYKFISKYATKEENEIVKKMFQQR